MEPGIAAALAAGRVVIAPSAQRAAALRWNWARLQIAEGRNVWATPEILAWDAWLESQWEKARLAGRLPAALRKLNRSQQLQLWQRVLASLEESFGEDHQLSQHAAALMSSAARAVQWMLPLSRLAVTDEERLLAEALAAAREWCREHDCVALPLCSPAQLAQFVTGEPPLIAGQRQLTALQQALGEQCWPGQRLLHETVPGNEARVRWVARAQHRGGNPRLCVVVRAAAGGRAAAAIARDQRHRESFPRCSGQPARARAVRRHGRGAGGCAGAWAAEHRGRQGSCPISS